tara:strand:- start:432 stop:641 length:210 start_codon:yes stop_codon:yes gene_type:complete
VKKNNQDETLFNTDINVKKDLEVDKIKTTNINILLNRVRLDQKRTFKKKIFYSTILIIFVSFIFFLKIY